MHTRFAIIRFFFPVLLAVVFIFPAAAQEDIPVYKPTVLNTYPHNPDHFTQGLFFSDGYLYESTGRYGRSMLIRKDPLTGQSLTQTPLADEYFGEGSCRVGDTIFVLTWKEKTCLLFNAQTMEPAGSFSYSSEGWGLAWNGRHLIRSDGSSLLHFHKLDGTPVGSLEVLAGNTPIRRLNELEWLPEENLILANIWLTTRVAAINPTSGQVVYWLELEDLVPSLREVDVANGLALAPDNTLWLTGKLWPVIYQVEWPVNEIGD